MPTDYSKFQLTHQLTFEGAWPTAIAFLDNDRVVSGNGAGELFVWDLRREPPPKTDEKPDSEVKDRAANLHPVRRLVGHTNGISRLILAPGAGGKPGQLVSASLDHTIRIWDVDAPSAGEADAVLDHDQRRRKAKNDKKREAEILAAPGVKVETQNAAHTLAGHKAWVNACNLSANGQRLVSGDDDGVTIVWDFAARKELKRWSGHPMTGVFSTAVTPDGKRAFVAEHRFRRGDFDRPPAQARLFALDSGELVHDVLALKFPDVKQRDNSYGYGEKWIKWVGQGFVAAEISPDGKLLAVAQGGEIGDAVAQLIDVETGKEVRSLSKHQYGVCDVKFSPDGQTLFTSGRDTLLKAVNVADGKELATLGKSRGGQFKDWLSAIAVSPDGQRLAAADIAGLVHVWQMPAG